MENQETKVVETTEVVKEQAAAKYTDEEMNGIVAKNKSKLISKFGVESEEQLSSRLAKLKEYEDAEKTDAEKRNEQLQEYEGIVSAKDKEIFDLKAKIKAAALGISDEDYEDAIILAKAKTTEEKDFDTALEEVVTRFQTTKKEKPRLGVETNTTQETIKKTPRVW